MLAGGFALVGLVAVLFILRGGEEPSLNPPKKKPTVKMYHVEGLDYPVVFEDGCNLKNLDIILKDLELIVSQSEGLELRHTEHIDYWNVLIGNEKKWPLKTGSRKVFRGPVTLPGTFRLDLSLSIRV